VSSRVIGKMDQSDSKRTKLKVVRIVTASYVVHWHLANTLKRAPVDFEMCVVGQDVSNNRVDFPDVKFFDININRKTSLISDGMALISLCRFLVSYKPDIVHSIMPKAGLLAAFAGIICRVPIRIHTFTGQTWVARKGMSRHFYYFLDRLINSLNTVCLTDSFSQSVFLLEHKISHSGQPLPVLSKGSLSGVDTERFNLNLLVEAVNQLREKLGLNKNNFVFSFIARKTREKGAVDMLRAFSSVSAIFKDVRLLFVGPDEDGEIERLHKTNPELFVNVIEVGHVRNHEVYLAITDVLCLPSYREGFGSIVVDAAAIGVPTIGSNIPGLADSVIDMQTGMLFPAGNLNELVKLMLAFIEDSELRQRMGNCAKTRVNEYFTADRLYEALKEFYLKCAMTNRGVSKKLVDLS
jgi:glycosyltransferase involved in cell wall biosynthesis